MSRAAKATLAASIVLSAATVWGVHFMQIQEREVSVVTSWWVGEIDLTDEDHRPGI